MNVPTGEPVERGRRVTDINGRDYIESLLDKDFTGYSVVTIHGETGLEEGIIVYRKGKIVSGDYTYFRYDKQYRSKEGLERAFNALNSRNGVVDVYGLSSHQLQLVLTLNDECRLEEPVTKENLEVPVSFTRDYEEQLIEEETEKMSRKELMKKYGLTGLQESGDTGGQLLQKARKEHRTLKKFLEKQKSK